MDGTQTTDSSTVDAQQGTSPQLHVGVHGVLDKDGDVHALQRIGNGLYAKGVGTGACTNPEDVDACVQGSFDMLGRCHFGGEQHAGFSLHALHPRQCLHAFAFEAAGFGTGFPYTGTEDADSVVGQLSGSVHHLFLGLGGAGTGDDHRSFVLNARQGKRL